MATNKTIGGNRNRTDRTSSEGSVTLNTSTAVTLVTLQVERIFFAVNNISNKGLWLQFQDDSGVFNNAINIPKKSYWEMPLNLYDGEIKAIAISGTPTITYTEY